MRSRAVPEIEIEHGASGGICCFSPWETEENELLLDRAKIVLPWRGSAVRLPLPRGEGWGEGDELSLFERFVGQAFSPLHFFDFAGVPAKCVALYRDVLRFRAETNGAAAG